jgi:energy-coupling factor transporter ATP-binding protein EcfA2
MDTLVQLKNMTPRYDGGSAPAVDDASRRIDIGHAVALVGPVPRCGKSVLLDLNAAGQTPTIVTHSGELTRRHARRVIHLADGQIAPGTPAARSAQHRPVPARLVPAYAPGPDQDALPGLVTSALGDFLDGRSGSAGRGGETEGA